MKVLITAGGTTEPIDRVRSITNTSTGKLGSLIAEGYDKNPAISKIYFICGMNSILPKSVKTEVVFVTTVASLENAVRNIIGKDTIDIIIHSMAVSDYRIEGIASAASLADTLNSGSFSRGDDQVSISTAAVQAMLRVSELSVNREGKLPSDLDDLILTMKKNPKIIALFHTLAPQAILVGFKLLDHVSHEVLINAANKILKDNRCSFVLANDLRDISPEQHIGYLVSAEEESTRLTSKEEIAAAVIAATLQRRSETC